MQAIILAGGLGTRLRPLVNDVPKSMAVVGGRPFIEHLLLQLQRNEFQNVVICAGHRAEQLDTLGDGAQFGLTLQRSTENQPLGTAGAIKLAEPLLSGDRWLVMNGDSFFDIPIQALVDRHQSVHAHATIALVGVDDGSRYGSVELDEDGAVRSFVEKGTSHGAALINAGLYIVERAVLDMIPDGSAVSLEREVLPTLIGRGLYGAEFDGFFIDIGVPADYERAQHSPALGGRAPEA